MTLTSVPDPDGRERGSAVSHADAPPPRERILAAALTAFSAAGYQGASTRQIARDAQVTHQLVTHYFASKQALWEAVVKSVFEPFAAAIYTRVEGLRGVEPRTVAKLVMAEFVVESAQRPELNRIVLQEAKAGGDRMRWLVDTYVIQFRDLIIRLFAPLGVAEGDPALASIYYALVGAAATIFSAAQECRLLFGIDPLERAFVEDHAERVAEMVLASIERSN
jgi:TetR/AcrR family transcriptional regulator